MLAIDLGSRQIRVVVGRARRNGLELARAILLDVPEGVDRADAKALGNWLAGELRQAGIREAQAVGTIDRRNVILKTTPLDGVNDAEIPEMVRLQAMRELTMPIDESTVDFTRVEARGPDEPAFALLAVARNEQVEYHSDVFAAAGLKLAGLWPGPLAQVLSLVGDPSAPSIDAPERPYRILIVADGDTVEVSLLHGRHCLFNVSRAAGARAESPAKTDTVPAIGVDNMAGKIEGAPVPLSPTLQALRRLKASLSTSWATLEIESVLYAGSLVPESQQGAEIAGELTAPIVSYDPLATLPAARTIEGSAATPGEEIRGGFAEVVGALALSARPAGERIDFLRPKKVVERASRARVAALLVAGLVLAVLSQGYFYFRRERDRLSRAASAVRQKEQALAKELKSLASVEAKARVVADFREQEVVWIDVLRQFMAAMPGTKEVFITQMSLSRQSREAESVALARIEGYANSSRTVSELLRRLREGAHFDVRPGAMQPAAGVEGYPWRFSADITLPKAKAEGETPVARK